MANKLKSKSLDNFIKGYNSFANSRYLIEDEEFGYGLNVVVDNNGSVGKRSGKVRYGAEIESTKAILGMGYLKNSTHNKVIVAAGTKWYLNNGTTTVALTGKTNFTQAATNFTQAIDRLYGVNGTDNLCYTTDGAAITEITSNGNVGNWAVYFNRRLYMTNTAYKDRIYYSNPYGVDYGTTTVTFSTTNFGTFDTDTAAGKTAGFFILQPGAGVEITRLFVDSQNGVDYLYAYTKNNIYRIGVGTPLESGVLVHDIAMMVTANGTPSGRSVLKVGNDQWFYGGDNYYSLGEVAQFQNVRISTKSGRIKKEINAIAIAGRSTVAAAFFNERAYISLREGSYNDRVLIYDSRLNAWSSPITNWNVSCFLEYEESTGERKLLAGSSNGEDSYVYQIDTGTDDVSTAISATFETKSTDCGLPGLIKRFAYIDVFYTTVFGNLTYEVYIDERRSIGPLTIRLGNATDKPMGIGSMTIGSFPVGAEYDPDTTFATQITDSSFRIDTGYTDGKRISVRFSNANTGEGFKINRVVVWYKEGNINEV